MRISDWSSDVCSSDLACSWSQQPFPVPLINLGAVAQIDEMRVDRSSGPARQCRIQPHIHPFDPSRNIPQPLVQQRKYLIFALPAVDQQAAHPTFGTSDRRTDG